MNLFYSVSAKNNITGVNTCNYSKNNKCKICNMKKIIYVFYNLAIRIPMDLIMTTMSCMFEYGVFRDIHDLRILLYLFVFIILSYRFNK